jgi:hypothetical protein
MPDWAIVLFAAFGGGLFGAVLQPVVSFVLQQINSGKEIARRRERSLRRMLNAEIVHGRGLMGFSGVIVGRLRTGVHTAQGEMFQHLNALSERRLEGAGLWQPERIADADLRSTAKEYNEVLVKLDSALFNSKYDEKMILQSGDRLEELQKKITARMDELNWPEVDD